MQNRSNLKDSKRIIVAIDAADEETALFLITRLNADLCRIKIGSTLFTRCGPALIKRIIDLGFDVFLDLKFHDIPMQVAGAVRAAAELGVWMVNVHAAGGIEMMASAYEALLSLPQDTQPLLTAVTLLTSLNADNLKQLGFSETAPKIVLKWASLAKQAGCDGIVCSAEEVALLRKHLGPDFCLVTPGIRELTASTLSSWEEDQQRTMTPKAAIEAGSDYLVIGRPITHAANPLSVLERIAVDITK